MQAKREGLSKLEFSSRQEFADQNFMAASPEDKEKRILYMGCSDFSLPPLQVLAEEGFHLVGVATQPDRPVGRKQKLTPTCVKVLAEELAIPVYEWSDLRNPEVLSEIERIAPELIITSSYGNILPKKIIDYPKYSCLNLHPSILPRWRGASPVASAILAGDKETAISLLQMTEGLDNGPVLASVKLPIEDEYDTPMLTAILADLSADLLLAALPYWLRGLVDVRVQDEAGATYAKKLSREDGLLDFTKSVRDNMNKVRALNPWPGAYTFYQGKRYKIYKASILEENTCFPEGNPGQVVRRGKNLVIRCKDGLLCVEILQGPGGKKLQACDCYHNFAAGSCFSSECE